MIIGINATAAIKQPRTGVEEYAYQLIKHLTMLPEAKGHRFLLYLPAVVPQGGTKAGVPDTNTRIGTNDTNNKYFDFALPSNFEIKVLRWPLPFLWTQIRLAWEMLVNPPEALFVPAHILPFGAPRNSVVVLHGLEYEYFPEHYSLWRRLYLRWSTKRAARRAKKIIAISENTKNDLVKLYGVKAEKIEVVHHGVSIEENENHPHFISPSHREGEKEGVGATRPYILYLGRIETKKNIQGILEAYKILKEEYKIPHELILAGTPGYGYKNLKLKIDDLLKIENCSPRWSRGEAGELKIKELGYVSGDEKWQLLAGADIFLFPSLYEGFGLSVLESQAMRVPVVTSYGSCLPEIAGQGALFVNPANPAQIAEAVKQVIDDKFLRDKLIQLGYENIKRFNWEKCAKKTLEVVIAK